MNHETPKPLHQETTDESFVEGELAISDPRLEELGALIRKVMIEVHTDIFVKGHELGSSLNSSRLVRGNSEEPTEAIAKKLKTTKHNLELVGKLAQNAMNQIDKALGVQQPSLPVSKTPKTETRKPVEIIPDPSFFRRVLRLFRL